MTREGEYSDSETFDSALAELGETGAAFLVCGDVPSNVHGRVCDRWLGGDDRLRLVVETEGTRAKTLGATETLTFETPLRSGAAAEASVGPGDGVRSLSALGTSLADSIDRLEHRIEEPGDLRVCVEAVDPLRYGHDDETVFRFLHLLVERVRAADGIVHVHLAASPDAAVTRTFAPLFDGTVTLRTRGGEAEERWYIGDRDVSSGWLPVTDDHAP